MNATGNKMTSGIHCPTKTKQTPAAPKINSDINRKILFTLRALFELLSDKKTKLLSAITNETAMTIPYDLVHQSFQSGPFGGSKEYIFLNKTRSFNSLFQNL